MGDGKEVGHGEVGQSGVAEAWERGEEVEEEKEGRGREGEWVEGEHGGEERWGEG